MREHGAMSGADQLHETLARDIRAAGSAWREPVHQALRAVRRHLFVAEVPLEEAYAVRSAVVTKRDPHGVPLSSASAPSVVALMLDQQAPRAHRHGGRPHRAVRNPRQHTPDFTNPAPTSQMAGPV
jgi:hypothetical protein